MILVPEALRFVGLPGGVAFMLRGGFQRDDGQAVLSYAGECGRSQSFRAASMRVCQPVPEARNVSTTSGDRRMVMRSLVRGLLGAAPPGGSVHRQQALVQIRGGAGDGVRGRRRG